MSGKGVGPLRLNREVAEKLESNDMSLGPDIEKEEQDLRMSS